MKVLIVFIYSAAHRKQCRLVVLLQELFSKGISVSRSLTLPVAVSPDSNLYLLDLSINFNLPILSPIRVYWP